MALTRTDKAFIGTVSLIAFSIGAVQFHRHGLGRKEGGGEVLESNRVEQKHVDVPASYSPTGKEWRTVPTRWFVPAHYRVRIVLDGKERWISVPLDRVGILEGRNVRLTYKEFPDGSIKVYQDS